MGAPTGSVPVGTFDEAFEISAFDLEIISNIMIFMIIQSTMIKTLVIFIGHQTMVLKALLSKLHLNPVYVLIGTVKDQATMCLHMELHIVSAP